MFKSETRALIWKWKILFLFKSPLNCSCRGINISHGTPVPPEKQNFGSRQEQKKSLHQQHRARNSRAAKLVISRRTQYWIVSLKPTWMRVRCFIKGGGSGFVLFPSMWHSCWFNNEVCWPLWCIHTYLTWYMQHWERIQCSPICWSTEIEGVMFWGSRSPKWPSHVLSAMTLWPSCLKALWPSHVLSTTTVWPSCLKFIGRQVVCSASYWVDYHKQGRL